MSKQDHKWLLSLDLNEQTLPAIEQVTDGMPGGFFIYHADGNEELIYANQAMVNIFGCASLEEFTEYVGNSFMGIVHPEDLEQVEKSIHSQIAKSSKGLDYVEYRVIRKDGVIRWIRDYGRFVHTSLYGDVFYVFVEDATERHLRELSDARAVQMARERLKVLRQLEHETTALRMVNEFFSSSMWSVEFSELGEMTGVHWSNEFRAMLGYRDEADFPNVLESWSDLLHEDDKERVLSEFYGVIGDESGERTCSVQYRLLTRDRGWRWYQMAGKLLRREDGTPLTYVGIFVDITAQKLTGEALETQRRLLDDALKQAQKAKQARSIFLNNMSHNLRTPMNAITGFATLAKMSVDDRDAAMEYMDQILSAAGELQSLIASLLNLSQIESGDLSTDETPSSLTDILWNLEATFRAEVRARQLHLSIEHEDLIHEIVLCDRPGLERALKNILDNAMKYTPAGGRIRLRLSESQGAPDGCAFYIISVQDTGAGMARETLERVFEPRDPAGESQGMGMAEARSIVEKMGGAIRVESTEGKGTGVFISIHFRLTGEDVKET